MAENLKEKTAKGLFWGALGNGSQQLLNLVFGIFFARLLSPDDYGMIGMLTIFSLIASTFVECGFTNALAKNKNVQYNDYNAVFWFSIIVSIFIYVVLFFSAPYIALFYHQPDLVPLARFSFLGFVISGTAVVPGALFYKQLKVKQKTFAQTMALFVSGVTGITMAYHGMSYWGIATQNNVYVLVYAISMWFLAHWRPSLHIDLSPIKGMFGFSSKLLFTNIFIHLNNNVMSVLLGLWFLRSDVGNYTQANKWNSMGYSLINNMILGVAMPVLASVDGVRERQRNIFRKMLRFASFVSFPLMFGLSLVAPEFISITITDKWHAASLLLQMLCVMGAFAPISSLYTNLIISDGRSNIYMYGNIALGMVQIIVLSSTRFWGITTMISVYVVVYVVWLIFWHYWAYRIIKLSLLDAFKDIAPFAAIAIVSMVISFIASQPFSNIYARFFFKIIIAGLIYVGVMKITNAVILTECIQFVLNKKQKIWKK